ncbi:MAG: hypothetical protein ACK5LJ_17880 [Paracoccus sp. (in: a-proteobacteria)]
MTPELAANLRGCARHVDECFHRLLPNRFDSPQRRVMMLAISGQESGDWLQTRQIAFYREGVPVYGKAHGLPQFEQNGGVSGVLRHPSTSVEARAVCLRRGVAPIPGDVWHAMAVDQPFAMAFAALLLYSDRAPLPALGDVEGAWAYYLRNWRPGKPHPDTWPFYYKAALDFVTERRAAA